MLNRRVIKTVLCLILVCCVSCEVFGQTKSHPPMRPLPVPRNRPVAEGPGWYVDAKRGDDTQAARRIPGKL